MTRVRFDVMRRPDNLSLARVGHDGGDARPGDGAYPVGPSERAAHLQQSLGRTLVVLGLVIAAIAATIALYAASRP